MMQLFMMLISGGFLGFALGLSVCKNIMQDEAVKHGYAKFDLETGEWEWK